VPCGYEDWEGVVGMSKSVEKRLVAQLKGRDEDITRLQKEIILLLDARDLEVEKGNGFMQQINSLDGMLIHSQEEAGVWKEMYERQSDRLGMEMLRDALRFHSYLYYHMDQNEISDGTWDEMFNELKRLEKERPDLATPDSPTQLVGIDIAAPLRHRRCATPTLEP